MDCFQYPKIAPQTHTKHIIKFLDWKRGVPGRFRSGQILESSRERLHIIHSCWNRICNLLIVNVTKKRPRKLFHFWGLRMVFECMKELDYRFIWSKSTSETFDCCLGEVSALSPTASSYHLTKCEFLSAPNFCSWLYIAFSIWFPSALGFRKYNLSSLRKMG